MTPISEKTITYPPASGLEEVISLWSEPSGDGTHDEFHVTSFPAGSPDPLWDKVFLTRAEAEGEFGKWN